MKQFAYGGQSPPAPISRQGFAGKSLPRSSRISFVNCARAESRTIFLHREGLKNTQILPKQKLPAL
ncbi:MAG: hypothetical protein LBP38_08005, partial [Desulfovibrio sp.]|nr:hypothetical protein [Desulfovibrio sp.]